MHANRIVETVRDAISGLNGSDRVVTATAIALERIRSDPLAQIMHSLHSAAESEGLLGSPMLAHFAAEMLGLSTPDPLAEQWLIRVFLALWKWPLKEPDAEREMLQ
jgi:hypothetical protein